MTKKLYVDGFVFLSLHIYRRHLSPPVRKMCPIPNLLLIGEFIIIFSDKTFDVLIFEKIHILVKIWIHGKPLQKCWIGVTFGHIS